MGIKMITFLYKLFPAFSQVHFRHFWISQWFALIGLWMQITAQQWLVYQMTGSALLLGFLGVAQFGPIMLFSLPAGVYVDRLPKRSLLRFTQTCFMLQAFLLALLVFTGWANYYNVLFLAFLYGCIQTIDTPARQSFIPELVETNYLRSAISMNSANFNVARMIGPALAAILMAEYGAGWLFLINGISMLPVLYVYWHLPIKGEPSEEHKERNLFAEIYDGLVYTSRHLPLYTTLLALSCISVFVMNYNVISPVYADQVLHEGITGFGMITTCVGIGSFTAAILSATRAHGRPGVKLLFGSGIAASLTLLLLSTITHYGLALVTFTIFGFFNLLFIINANTTIQMNTDLAHRGRMLALYSLVFLGGTPPGNIITGALIQSFGVEIGIFICAFLALIIILPIAYYVYRKLQNNPCAFINDYTK